MNAVKNFKACDELGACQSRTPACANCDALAYPFAPGVIDGYPKQLPSAAATTWLVRWVCLMLCVTLVCFVAGLLV